MAWRTSFRSREYLLPFQEENQTKSSWNINGKANAPTCNTTPFSSTAEFTINQWYCSDMLQIINESYQVFLFTGICSPASRPIGTRWLGVYKVPPIEGLFKLFKATLERPYQILLNTNMAWTSGSMHHIVKRFCYPLPRSLHLHFTHPLAGCCLESVELWWWERTKSG